MGCFFYCIIASMQSLYFDKWEGSHIPDILKEIYLDKVYDPILLGRKDLTIVDLGANIGLTSMYFSKFGKVYSVEPAQVSFDCLSKMAKDNKLDITPIRYAVGTHSNDIIFYHNDNSTANSMFPNLETAGKEKVPCRTIAQIFKEYKIKHVDLLKMDIEGMEFEVLGSDTFDEVAPMIDCIIGETHSWTNRNQGQVYQALKNRGYKVKKVSTEADVFYAER